MICPACKAEYRQRFTHCAECDVDLFDALSPERKEELIRIWAGDSQETCAVLCQQLKDAGIHYEVTQGIKSRDQRMRVSWRYELGVPAEKEKRAKELLELPETVVEESSELDEEDEDQSLLEWPEEDESAPTKERKKSSYSSPWYAEDATVEVFSETLTFQSDMIEMSLKENQIRARIEVQEDGFKKVFVLPEDEALAREIVREIVEGAPPE